MPVRRATQQETKDWLGNGIVMPGPRQANSSTEQSAAGQSSINSQETEQDGMRAEALRRLKVRRQLMEPPAQTQPLALLPNDLPGMQTDILEKCISELNSQLQEWLGSYIPDKGSEDYEIWQMKIALIEQVESVSDVYDLCDGGDFKLPSALEEESGE
jgi:hypothetical protein